jgi:hypothetical protein
MNHTDTFKEMAQVEIIVCKLITGCEQGVGPPAMAQTGDHSSRPIRVRRGYHSNNRASMVSTYQIPFGEIDHDNETGKKSIFLRRDGVAGFH